MRSVQPAEKQLASLDLNVLLGIEQIKRLKARYFRFLDTKNWTAMRDVFAENALLEDPAKNLRLEGRDAILAFLQERHATS